jgi:hypothetical protein
MEPQEPGFFAALIKDGRPLLSWTALALLFSGGFALFLSASGQFLPHDMAFLGISAAELRGVAGGRLVSFMFHDRVAFGGSLLAIACLYLWLVEFPLARGEPWAWWTLLLSGGIGFSSFLSYLGYGYLDTWHGVGTLALLPLFVLGLVRSYTNLRGTTSLREALQRCDALPWTSFAGIGRLLLLLAGVGMVVGGGTIMVVGMTSVFVPQDLAFMQVVPRDLVTVNPRLIPLIAHDRAGFGGGICSCGLLVCLCAWCAQPSRSLWQALGLAGTAGFGTAIGVHFVIGYHDFVHLVPAYAGCIVYVTGLAIAILGHGSRAVEGTAVTGELPKI